MTLADRRHEVRAFLRAASMSGRGEQGGMGHVPAAMQSDREVGRIARESAFADAFPPFTGGSVWVAGAYVWVVRARPITMPPLIDVFDRRGRRVASVTLPESRRVVGFGTAAIYATVTQASGLLVLERFRTPAIPN